ncbi:MAG: hypothetical protein CEN87_718 [Parcubacteria group bacterium Licking1014_1]|nr:MAG: hypothetical protein CEN87_718 [Parcubacteria group bacterium Licking1014_1]
MTNFSIIENKITSIGKYLNIVGKYRKYSKDEIEKNLDLSGAVERYLYLVSQACIDLAEAVVSFKDFRKPTTYRESFEILEEEKIISVELREKMVKMSGFRNVIAHDYAEINYDTVYDVLQNKLIDIEQFISEIKKSLNI